MKLGSELKLDGEFEQLCKESKVIDKVLEACKKECKDYDARYR